jgi:cardiolipin synthase A/B
MRMSLLVDANPFRAALDADLATARDSVLLQTLSFEGDGTGRHLASALHRCAATDRRVLVDSFSRAMLSCSFLLAPRSIADERLQREATATSVMLERLNRRGVGVRYGAPLGALLRRLPARNHKKSVLIDDRIAYIGGFNFSDHNFAWHDMMLRIDDERVAAFLRKDFDTTWARQPRPLSADFDGLALDVLDGRSNSAAFVRLFKYIGDARREIVVHTPYLMFPFTTHLAAAARNGVRVTVITPEHNTIPALRRYIAGVAARYGFGLHVYQGCMSHLKAILIDDECLVMGSSNFDYLSYRRFHEIVAYITDIRVIQQFRGSVLEPDLARSVRVAPRALRCASVGLRGVSSRLLEMRLRATGLALVALSA